MAGDIIPVIFKGSDSGTITLPIDFGTLGGDIIFVQRILDAGGAIAINDSSGQFSDTFQGSTVNASASADELFMALIRTPGTRFQN